MELLFCLVLAAALVYLLTVALGFAPQTVAGDVLKAGGFPVIIIVIALVVLFFIMLGYVRKCKKDGKPIFSGEGIHRNVLANVGIVTGYIVLMNVAGFALSTLAFTFLNARVMGYKNYKALTIFSAIVTVALVLIFGKLFYIPLPRGLGFLRELSYYVY